MRNDTAVGSIRVEQSNQKIEPEYKSNHSSSKYCPSKYCQCLTEGVFLLFRELLRQPGYHILIHSHRADKRAIYPSENEGEDKQNDQYFNIQRKQCWNELYLGYRMKT